MNSITEKNCCHVCLEVNVKTISDFDCQTKNCQFLICEDCKQIYFVELEETTCPGCRQECIGLNNFLKNEKTPELPSVNQNVYQDLVKVFKIVIYIVVATVLAYWIGVFILHSTIPVNVNEPSSIFLRILIGYIILFLVSVCVYLSCCNPEV